MIVMKFGGTSVEDAAALQNVAEIIRSQIDRQPVVVVSAIAKATNQLLKCAGLAAEGKIHDVTGLIRDLQSRHHTIINILVGTHPETIELRSTIDATFEELVTLAKGLAILGELSPRSLDAFGAAGEQMSSAILTGYLNTIGIPAELIDARSYMITDDGFTKAFPRFEEIQRLAPAAIKPSLARGKVVVTQGFIGSTADGVTTTLGRGGSDYSAAIIGAVLGAGEIQIWTDVDGIMTADPSVVPAAKQIPEMTFDEAAELAYFGARVLHPATVQPAYEKNIPVSVLNSKRPGGGGTIIRKTLSKNSNGLIKSIAYKEGISVVTVRSTRMLMQSGFLARLFDVFSRHGKSVDVVATSEVTVSLTVDNSSGLEGIERELSEIATVHIQSAKAIVCVVGERMKYTPGIAARIFASLDQAGINVEIISQGGSDISLTFVINESEITQAVQALHTTFF